VREKRIDLKYLKYIVISTIMLLVLSACTKVSDEDLTKAREAVKNGALIVDVRTPKEYREKHIPNAINIPIGNILKGQINLPKDKEIVLYCRTGSRSGVVAKVLKEKGWSVYDVANQSEWEREIKKK